MVNFLYLDDYITKIYWTDSLQIHQSFQQDWLFSAKIQGWCLNTSKLKESLFTCHKLPTYPQGKAKLKHVPLNPHCSAAFRVISFWLTFLLLIDLPLLKELPWTGGVPSFSPYPPSSSFITTLSCCQNEILPHFWYHALEGILLEKTIS